MGPNLLEGPIFQVAWVVDDIAAAEARFGDQLGVAKWLRIPDVVFGPHHCRYRGAPADFSIHVSIAYAGGQQVELIEPVSGSSLYQEFLHASGPGVHHIGYVADDFAGTVAEAERRGIGIPQQGSFPGAGMQFAYLEGGPLGSYVEVMGLSADLRAMFDQLIPAGHKNPWQP